jgi:hypothetical protein
MDHLERQPDLLEIIGADHAVGGVADLPHGGQQQRDQHADDGNHDQQFDQRERPGSARGKRTIG